MFTDLIYDVGMNNGDDTAYYLHRGYRVVAIEANPELVAAARERFATAIDEGRLTMLNVGIAAEAGDAEFWICDAISGLSSFERALASRGGSVRSVQVPCRPFAAIVSEHGVPFYAKIDIEGRESLCLDDLPATDTPAMVSVETVDVATLDRLHALGYAQFQWIHQHHLLPIEWPPAPSQRRRERLLRWSRSRRPLMRLARRLGGRRWLEAKLRDSRTRNGWTFPTGSAGPFGEDLPSGWVSFEVMRATMTQVLAMRARRETSILWDAEGEWLWADLHARRGAESVSPAAPGGAARR